MALVDLGLSDAEFRSMSPAEFGLLRERLDVRERRADARAALVARMWSDGSVTLEQIIANLRALPDRPYVPTRAELEAQHAKALADFDKAVTE